jgi:hypothetical protein
VTGTCKAVFDGCFVCFAAFCVLSLFFFLRAYFILLFFNIFNIYFRKIKR